VNNIRVIEASGSNLISNGVTRKRDGREDQKGAREAESSELRPAMVQTRTKTRGESEGKKHRGRVFRLSRQGTRGRTPKINTTTTMKRKVATLSLPKIREKPTGRKKRRVSKENWNH